MTAYARRPRPTQARDTGVTRKAKPPHGPQTPQAASSSRPRMTSALPGQRPYRAASGCRPPRSASRARLPPHPADRFVPSPSRRVGRRFLNCASDDSRIRFYGKPQSTRTVRAVQYLSQARPPSVRSTGSTRDVTAQLPWSMAARSMRPPANHTSEPLSWSRIPDGTCFAARTAQVSEAPRGCVWI